MTFTSSSSKLLAAAFHDASSKRQGDRGSLSYYKEDHPVNAEQLDITLEFQKEKDDSMISLPPIINLSIHGSDPLMSVNNTIVDHLKASQSVVENRFRASARACLEGSLGWASSAFPANDVKSRSTAKLQSLGKHKLSVCDSIRPFKSKLGRTSVEHGEMQFAEPGFWPVETAAPNDLNMRFDITPAIIQDSWIDNIDSSSSNCIEDELSLEMKSSEMVPT